MPGATRDGLYQGMWSKPGSRTPSLLASLPFYMLNAERGWQHAPGERRGVGPTVVPGRQGDVLQTDEGHTRWGGQGREPVGLSLPMPSTQDTWNMQNADQRTPGKDGGRGTGKNELSNSKRGSEMLCWGHGRVTSVVVLSLVHDRHCSNTKREVNPIIWAT